MTAIWLLSTRGRPDEAQATIDACARTGMTSPGVVYTDGTRYPRLRLPRNWEAHHEPEWLGLQGSMQWCFETFPDATAYGWLADDTRPRSDGWDRGLEQAAGRWNLAYANDLWFAADSHEAARLADGFNLSSGLCFGGDLVRAVGWWALPGVRQAGIDTAWTEIVRPLGLHRYRPDIVVEHLNWRTGKRPRDDGDDWESHGVEEDLARRNQWLWSNDYRETLINVSLCVELDRPVAQRVLTAVRESLADEAFATGRGMPAARIDAIMKGAYDDLVAARVSVHADGRQAAVAHAMHRLHATADPR